MRFGIIGTNFVTRSFMDAVSKNKDVEVTLVCSGKYENAVKFAEEFDIPNTVKEYKEMIDCDLIDAVYIATPNAMHFEQAKFFLEHKVPVFLEKPMCSNVKDAKELVRIALENNTYLHHGIMPLYMPNMAVLKDSVAKIGRIHNAFFVFSKYSSRYDAYLHGENPTTFRKELSNGSIMDLGIYPLSIIVSLFGKPTKISASASLLDTGVDAAFQALLNYDDFSISVMSSKASDTSLICEMSGEKGMLQIPHPSLLDDIILKLRGEEEVHSKNAVNPFVYQLEDFISEISKGNTSPELVPYELSISLMEVLDEIRECCGIIYPADC